MADQIARPRRIARHVKAHPRSYLTLGAVGVGAVIMGLGDFALGVLGNLVASIVGPIFGIH